VVNVKVVGTRIGKRLFWSARLPDVADLDLSGSAVDMLVPGATEGWPSAGRVWFDGLHYRTIIVPTRYRRQWAACRPCRVSRHS
jgi:hypothetical protein